MKTNPNGLMSTACDDMGAWQHEKEMTQPTTVGNPVVMVVVSPCVYCNEWKEVDGFKLSFQEVLWSHCSCDDEGHCDENSNWTQ